MAFDDTADDFSPGLSSGTPETSLALPPVSGDGDLGGPMADGSQGDFSMPSTGFNLASAGLNLAKPRTRSQDDIDYLQNLPTGQKIGLALQAFSAGVAGKDDPIDKLLKDRRAQQAADRADLATTITTISKGTEILRKMPPGIARDAVAAELGKAVGGGQLAKVFEAAGDQHTEIKEVLSTFTDPDVQNQLLKSCSGSTDFRACVMTQARDKDFMDRAHAMADSKRMGTVTTKLAAAIDQAKKAGILDQFKGTDGKYEVPFAKLIELNDKTKIFSQEEMDTIKRNEDMLSPFGIKTTKALVAAAAEKAKQGEKPLKEDFKEGATRRILDPAGAELQQEYKDGAWVTIGKRRDKDKPDKPLTLAQEAADERVLKARQDVAGLEKADVAKRTQKDLPNGKPNPDYDPDLARNWRLSQQPLFADVKARRDAAKAAPKEKPAAAAPPTEEKPPAPAAEKPAAKAALSDADRKAVVDAATAAVNGGADAEAVKKRLKDRYGIDVTFKKK